MLVADANVAIAILTATDAFHETAIRRCALEDQVAVLNVTRAEALVHPTRAGVVGEAAEILDSMGFVTYAVDDDTADRARVLRADHGNRHFPMVDALVVAFGIERGWPIVTSDAKWPSISEADIQVLVE